LLISKTYHWGLAPVIGLGLNEAKHLFISFLPAIFLHHVFTVYLDFVANFATIPCVSTLGFPYTSNFIVVIALIGNILDSKSALPN
jgi:hypothetical protein